jgi:hypothetical protein
VCSGERDAGGARHIARELLTGDGAITGAGSDQHKRTAFSESDVSLIAWKIDRDLGGVT